LIPSLRNLKMSSREWRLSSPRRRLCNPIVECGPSAGENEEPKADADERRRAFSGECGRALIEASGASKNARASLARRRKDEPRVGS
jgi:hypothetical protein